MKFNLKLRGTLLIAGVLVAFAIMSYVAGLWIETPLFQNVLSGPFGMFVYIVLTAASAVIIAPLSTVPLMPLATTLWGPMLTALLSVAGWTLGAIVAFTLARRYGQQWIATFFPKETLRRIAYAIPQKYLFWNVVFLRMILPVDVLSYSLGAISNMRFAQYTFATAIGVTPFAFVFSYVAVLSLRYQIVTGLIIFAIVVVFNVHAFRSSLRARE